MIALYVDDLLTSRNSKSDIAIIKKEQSARFEMKNLGPEHVILGIKIRRDRPNRKLFITQSEYTKEILGRFGMSDSKYVATPMDRSYSELVQPKSAPANDVPYRQVFGSLMYLMIGSEPDLAFVIGKLSQHAESPSNFHCISAKRFLFYLNSTRDYVIAFDGNKTLASDGFSDAD